jgi:ELWxxDGT repeat protein
VEAIMNTTQGDIRGEIHRLRTPVRDRNVATTHPEGRGSSRRLRVTASLVLGLLIAACGGGGSSAPPAAAAITAQPTDQSVVAGASAPFSVTATDATGYQWQASSDGGATFGNVPGATSPAYTTPATAMSDSGTQFRVVVTGASNSVTSATARLTVTAAVIAPSFATQPQGQSIVWPATASFTAAVNGTPAPTLQWQVSTDSGSNWSDIAGATAATFTTPATVAGDAGKQFRVVASNSAGTVNSNAAILTVTAPAQVWFFAADDGTHGQELWKTDGTATGTVMVKDINNSANASSFPTGFTAFNGAVYFLANDGTAAQLWKTDGSAAGTVLVKTFPSSQGYSFAAAPLTLFNGALFFEAWDPLHGNELWRSDGTPAGTALFMDIHSGLLGGSPQSLTVLGNKLLFSASDGVNGAELWISDGTVAGTMMLKDINPGLNPIGPENSCPRGLSVFNGAIYFGASNDYFNNCSTPDYLWQTDGTAAGTIPLLGTGTSASARAPGFFTAVNNVLYFAALDSSCCWELLRSDGTIAGTVVVKDNSTGLSSRPDNLTDLNGKLYFYASDPVSTGLWTTDGTNAGTVKFKDLAVVATTGSFTVFNNAFYFAADSGTSLGELWKSDGTAAGTVMVKDINPGFSGSYPNTFKVLNGALLFFASDGVSQNQLWKTDGTAAGTIMVKTIHP